MEASKDIKFVPLRRVKKTGKIIVASYLQWNKVKSADQIYGLDLTLLSGLEKFNTNERVYNHKGEFLFWYNHKNPESLAKWKPSVELMDFMHEQFEGEFWKLQNFEIPDRLDSFVKGFDCNGTPVFSHYTQDYISIHCKEVKDFEILTVGAVLKWYGWFIYNLKNTNIKYTKSI